VRLMPLVLLVVACSPATTPTDPATHDTDTDVPVVQGVVVRVVTWNVQGLGTAGSTEGQAERAVLARIDADVVGLNEIDEDQRSRLDSLAADLGYNTVYYPPSNPFGGLRNAILTRLPVVDIGAPTPAQLSGDAGANDCTRRPVRVTIDVPDAADDLTVVVNHWKSGFDLTDRFRRTLDGIRTAQAADTGTAAVVMGDVNAELDDMPESPATWSYVPDGLPRAYRVGDDQRDALQAEGLPNSAFAALRSAGLTPIDALQLDGRPSTRPSSDRVIDYILVSETLVEHVDSEIYDSTDEGQAAGLPKAGEAPDRGVSDQASDHLPVFADLTLERAPAE